MIALTLYDKARFSRYFAYLIFNIKYETLPGLTNYWLVLFDFLKIQSYLARFSAYNSFFNIGTS
jgi:hypothetical protein